MKTRTLAAVTPVTTGFALGLVVAPALVGAGLSLLGAFSALVMVMLVHYFVAECAY